MLFANNANTTLSSSLTNSATSMSVTSASAFPSPTGSQYFYCTLADAATQQTIEIVKVTAVSGTTFTIVRGQDGTSGTAFNSGDVVSLRLVRASLNDFPKLDENNTFTYAPTFNTALAVGSGGTGLATLTAGYIPYGNGTSAFNSSSALSFGGTALTVGNTSLVDTAYVIKSTIAAGYIGTQSTYSGWSGVSSLNLYPAMNIGTTTNHPIVFGTNNIANTIIFASGGFSIGNGTDPGSGNLLINNKLSVGYNGTPSEVITAWGVPTTYGDSRFNGSFFDTTSATTGTGSGIAFSGYSNGTTGGATFAQIKGIKENSTAGNTAGAFVITTLPNGGTPTERIRIDSSGNFLIGTTSADPISSQVNGISLGSDSIIRVCADSVPNAAFSRRGSDGSIINFIKNATQVGNISVTNVLTTYNTTSDYRLKNVIASVSNSGTRIDALEPIEYEWNNGGGRTRGFLAHKFAEVYPDSVNGEKDAVDSEDKPIYQSMQASSTEVMADLIAEIQSLRKRIAILEEK